MNFGIFELYGDRALVDALDIIVKMILSIPLADIFAYRKVLPYIYSMFLICWLTIEVLSSGLSNLYVVIIIHM